MQADPMQSEPTALAPSSPSQGLIAYTHVIYALHALTAISGVVTGSIFMPVAFICGLPSAVAVLMNYARRSEARGTWLQTHFRWQIRTFWFATFWVVVTALVSLPLMLILIGFAVGLFGLATVAAWIIYRVIRGWLALREARPMPLPIA